MPASYQGLLPGATWTEALKKLAAQPRPSLAEEVRSHIQPILLTIEEAAILAKVSRDRIERMIRSGDLRAANMAPDPSTEGLRAAAAVRNRGFYQ